MIFKVSGSTRSPSSCSASAVLSAKKLKYLKNPRTPRFARYARRQTRSSAANRFRPAGSRNRHRASCSTAKPDRRRQADSPTGRDGPKSSVRAHLAPTSATDVRQAMAWTSDQRASRSPQRRPPPDSRTDRRFDHVAVHFRLPPINQQSGPVVDASGQERSETETVHPTSRRRCSWRATTFGSANETATRSRPSSTTTRKTTKSTELNSISPRSRAEIGDVPTGPARPAHESCRMAAALR